MSLVVTANSGKTFEKPDSGFIQGVLADVVDLGLVKTTFKGDEKEALMVRFIWVLEKNGTDGKPLTVAQRFTASLHEKANLYKTVKQILNSAPPTTFDLESMIGQSRTLLIAREKSADGQKDYANVMGIGPQNGNPVAIPADFIRAKNKPAKQGTAAAAPQQAQAAVAGKPDVAF